MDISVAFPASWQGENPHLSSEKMGHFKVKVRSRVYDRESREAKWVNQWIDVRTFANQAERLRDTENFPKGCVVFVRGSIDEIRAYTDKEGKAVASLTVMAESVSKMPKEFLDPDEAQTEVDEDEDETPPPPPRRPGPPRPTTKVAI